MYMFMNIHMYRKRSTEALRTQDECSLGSGNIMTSLLVVCIFSFPTV